MKFKYSAFTENTTEMREWLEELGYLPLKFFLKGKYIITKFCIRATAKAEWVEPYFESINNTRDSCTSSNCIGNPNLFQAVTAIREDSDYLQWFVIDRINGATEEYVSDFRLSIKDKFDITEVPLYGIVDYHKATLSELIAHFKINK